MQNKTFIWGFAILLVLASLYQLSFTWVADSVESQAVEVAQQKADSLNQNGELTLFELDSAKQSFETEYLLLQGPVSVYPVLEHTYSYVKKREINLGLDLQGGMHVTLEVSEADLVREMAGSNRTNPTFVKIINQAIADQRNSSENFVTLFANAHQEVAPDFKLAAVFHNLENKDKIKPDATDEEIISIIATESEDAITRTEQVLRKRVDNLGVVQPKIQRLSGSGRIIVELPGIKDKKRARKFLQGTARLEFWECYDNTQIIGALDQANTVLRATFKSDKGEASDVEAPITAEEVPDNDIADLQNSTEIEGDTAVADSTEKSIDDLMAEVEEQSPDSLDYASMSDAEKEAQNPLFYHLSPMVTQEGGAAFGPRVGYARVADTAIVNKYLKRKDVKQLFPPRTRFLWEAKAIEGTEDLFYLYAIKVPKGGTAELEGDVVTDARVGADPLGNAVVNMNMNSTGANIWKKMTARLSKPDANGTKRAVAVVLDGLVYSAPTVQGEIPGGQTEITGNFTQQEASDLAGVLKAGKLPAPLHIIEEAIVGPSLGQEAIDSGWSSFMIALMVILVYMIFYYSSAGVVADIALAANLFFILGFLASLRATLTLPGIAGIVLTIGMSVDANVLIYERIREELRGGKGFKQAINDGYKAAYSSILDSNITTMLTGIILFVFGTGPIQGFATTLIIGIITSLFSAIFVTRLIFEWAMGMDKKISFSTKLTENAFQNLSINFLGKRKMFYLVSLIIVIIGAGSLLTRGLNYGVDFTGGRSYIVRFDKPVNVSEVSAALADQFVNEDGLKNAPEVKTFGSTNQVKITTKYMIENTDNDVDDILEDKLYAGLSVFYDEAISAGDFKDELTSQKVEPTIADDIKESALIAVIFSLIVIFAYILIRFSKWQFSAGAIAALAHDVIIVLSIFSILYGMLPFSLEIDQAFIAAILTVVGYSINDTVVVFDRLREYLGLHPNKDSKDVINSALNSTISRTVNTSLSTFVVLLIIFFFGGEMIRGFIFAMIVGVVVGTYSSLFIATPISYDLSKGEMKH
ncbi:protein translocase subunit SecDF [bacterium SCSIO 12643]|nr:protein translocase subunit SecDF [bacterium SCSIO 12643]